MSKVTIISFGYSHGEAPSADWIIDVRNISGDVVNGLWERNGLDSKVYDAVMATPEANEWLEKIDSRNFADGEVCAIGCNEGIHRSVAVAKAAEDLLTSKGFEVVVQNRDLEKRSMAKMETREFVARADVAERTITGIAVPYGQTANIGAYQERFAPGAIDSVDDVKLFYGHTEPIGKVIEGRDTETGFEITAKLTEGVQRADEVLALMRDGVLNKFSVGFVPLESERDGNTVIRTKVALKETSIVPFPAYEGANITEVREEVANPQPVKETMSENLEFDMRSLQDEVAEIRRTLEAQPETPAEEAPVAFRSAAELLKAVAKGDAQAERAYTGATTADSVVKNGWVGDLTRIVDEAATLRGVFASGTLPSEGNFIEYAVLDANTMDVDVQVAEGDDLPFGKVSLTTETAPVKTLGGYTQLTRQEIERSSVNILDHSLRAQAIQVGKALNIMTRTAYVNAVADQITALDVVTIPATPDYNDWLAAITDAAIKFNARGLSMDALIVDTATFKSLAALQGTDGRPVLLVTGGGTNNVGTINVTGLTGSVASVTVVLDPQLDGEIAFVNSNAIRVYGSPVVRLQDENVINLSKDFSVYTYAAVANEIIGGIVPVVVD